MTNAVDCSSASGGTTKRTCAAFLCILAFSAALGSPLPATGQPVTAIDGGTLIDTKGGAPVPKPVMWRIHFGTKEGEAIHRDRLPIRSVLTWRLGANSTGGMTGSGIMRGAQALPRVLVRTEMGDIELEIDTVRAPVTARNFLRYVDGGFFNGGHFQRTVRADNQPTDSVRIAVIQAMADAARRGEGFSPIVLERTSATGLRHEDGCLSMARAAPNSATSSFFICVGDQPALDFGGRRNPDGQGFAAFGRVVSGMDVVRAINASPAQAQALVPPIRILEMARK